ncbi:MAG: DNA-3-methyladenine glycosylase family protein [Methanobacterium sp.]
MSYSTHLKLKPVAPYDLKLNVRMFIGNDPGISGFEKNKFWQVIRVNDKPILVIIESTGSVDEPELSVTLKSDTRITDNDKISAENTIIYMFNLDFDLKEFYEYIKNDSVLFKITKEIRGLNNLTSATVFEGLASSIIEQQISYKAAQSIERHMIRDHGEQLHIDDKVYYAFPTPESLSKLTKEKLRESGLSLRKADYIINISKLILANKLDLENFKKYTDMNAIIEELSQLRGVGEWTANLTVLRSMHHRHQAFPADDLGLRKAISHYYCHDNKISADDARKIAKKWGKWKGLAAYHILVSYLET